MRKSKKQQILDSALTLFVRQGIHSTSTASIAKAANVANGTLFHHFTTKEELVLQLYQHIKQDFAHQVAPKDNAFGDLKSQAKAVWNDALDWTIEHSQQQEFCLLVMHYQPLTNQLKEKVLAEEFGYLHQLIEYGLKNDEIINLPSDFIIDHCHGIFMNTSNFFINHPEKANDINYRDAAFELFWRSIEK